MAEKQEPDSGFFRLIEAVPEHTTLFWRPGQPVEIVTCYKLRPDRIRAFFRDLSKRHDLSQCKVEVRRKGATEERLTVYVTNTVEMESK